MKFRQISGAYPLRFWPFAMLLHFSLKKNSPKFASATTRKWRLIASCCNAFCTKTHCILHQNALHFAPKRTAICTKTQGKMQRNARWNAAKCNQNPPETPYYALFIGILTNWNEKLLGGVWLSVSCRFASLIRAKKACFCALFLVNINESIGYKL